jgi:hypothetical protein
MAKKQSYEEMLTSFIKSKGKVQKKASGGDIYAKNMLEFGVQGASLGASVGSVVPVVGTLLGAAIGTGAGLIGGGIKSVVDVREMNKSKSEYDQAIKNMISLQRQNSPQGIQLADGGYVNGGGTGKSDSISANIKPNSFVIPVDTPYPTEAKLLMKALGTNNKPANLNSGSEPVKLSKGELLVSAEQRSDAEKLLSGLGIQGGLASLAPNAKVGNKKADGGFSFSDTTSYDPNDYNEWRAKISKLKPDYFNKKSEEDALNSFQAYQAENQKGQFSPQNAEGETRAETPTQKSLGESLMSGLNPDKNSKAIDVPYNGFGNASDKSNAIGNSGTNKSVGSNTPSLGTIASIGQGVLGAANLLSMDKEPKREVSPELRTQYASALKEAQYGMTNAQKQGILQDVEMNRRTSLNALVKSGGIRSSQDALARAMAVGQQANRAALDLNVKDAQLKAQKQARVDSMAARLAGEESAVYGAGEHKYERDQRASGALLQAGINNVVEIDRLKRLTKDPEALKAYLDLMDKRGLSRMTTGKIN